MRIPKLHANIEFPVFKNWKIRFCVLIITQSPVFSYHRKKKKDLKRKGRCHSGEAENSSPHWLGLDTLVWVDFSPADHETPHQQGHLHLLLGICKPTKILFQVYKSHYCWQQRFVSRTDRLLTLKPKCSYQRIFSLVVMDPVFVPQKKILMWKTCCWKESSSVKRLKRFCMKYEWPMARDTASADPKNMCSRWAGYSLGLYTLERHKTSINTRKGYIRSASAFYVAKLYLFASVT